MKPLQNDCLAYLVDVLYNGKNQGIDLIFYEPTSRQLYSLFDNSHKPYCLTNMSIIDINNVAEIVKHPSFFNVEIVKKYDALQDKDVTLSKIVMKDPKSVGGGKPTENVRDIITTVFDGKVWEGKIPYEFRYICDMQLEIGMAYVLKNGRLYPVKSEENEKRVTEITDKIGISDKRWVRLCEYPIPDFLRVSLDIEVLGEEKTRVPDPYKAEYPVISVSLVGSDGRRWVLLLLREGIEIGEDSVDAPLEFFEKESDLILKIFSIIEKYPFVVTFNGNNFDLMYLYYRALNIGIKKEDIPLLPSREGVKILGHIHVDLYNLFFNRSLRNYAFQAKYNNIKLDEIAMALLGKGKLHANEDIWLATEMRKWTYCQLAKYNNQDAEITLELTQYDDDLVMKLIVILMRLSALTMEDLIRLPISQWIKGMLYFEHVKRNWLIPNREDILTMKGQTETKATIKGKKYKGAIVVDPVAGVHFNVKVADFASLYPSIIKVYNLGYQTIRCGHKDCESNLTISDTSHWVCRKHRAMESEIIGMLKDLRVFHYKKNRKDNPLYEIVEQSLKVLLNASYGVFGADNFDLYCPPMPESVTALGRHAILKTMDKAKQLGIEVLYGDTDSSFLKNPTEEQVKKLIDWCTETFGLDLEIDKEYRYVCLSSRKKNYLGVTIAGKLDVKGLTGKKKHIPPIIRDAFNVTKGYFEKAEKPEDIQGIKIALRKLIRQLYVRIKNRDFELSELAFSFSLGKPTSGYDKTMPQHVKAAKQLEESLGILLKKGDSIDFVKCIGDPNVKPLQLAKKEDVDISKYHEILRSTFEQVLDSLDLEYDKIIGITKLEQYF